MKGFYIYEVESRIGTVVDCLELGDIGNIFTHEFAPGTITEEVKMQALVSKGTKSKCSKDDTYDFEVGALIALMKMCGVEKVVRACNEAFPKERYNTYVAKLEGKLHELKKDFDKLGDRNKYLIEDINKKLEYIKEKDEENKRLEASNCAKGILNGKLLKDYNTAQNAYEVMVEKSADLMDKVKKLEEENEKLKSDKDKTWKIYQRNVQKKQDRINELNNIEEGYIKLREEYDSLFEEKEKLQHEYNLCLNSENALKYTVDSLNKSVDKLNKAIVGYKNDLYNTAKRCKELKEENEKLKTDCEKLQHGYIDTDMIFCGGRQNGKQYTALVNLFKKLDQKKVDAAYKEAYGDRVIWCTSQSSTRDYLDSLIEGSKYAIPYTTEWIKPPTKREEMWDVIFAIHKEKHPIIVVKKEDVNTFLHEIENKIPEITWASGNKIFETKYTIGDIYGALKTCDTIYFRLSKENTLSYSSDQYIYPSYKFKHIDYLPPMRWDLFKKGRLAVKVNYYTFKEFYDACEKELGKRPLTMFPCTYTVSICKKDGNFEIFTIEDQKKTGKKIVNWEDVRENKTTTEDPYDTWKW